MRRTCGAVLAAALVLSIGACGSDEPESTSSSDVSTLKSSDDVQIAVPKDWKQRSDKQAGALVLVAQGSNDINQLLVSKFDSKDAAYNEALYTVAGLTAKGMACKPAKLEGNSMFDCPDEYQGEAYRRLFFPVENGDVSYLVLVQTPGESLAEAAKIASPIVDSITFD